MKKTKIIATVWPATDSEEKLIELYKAWVNIIRFNFSHANYTLSKKIIETIKKLNSSWITNLSLLLDTKWPEIRTWDVVNKINITEWDIFRIYIDETKMEWETSIFCDYPYLLEDIEKWNNIIIDSGLLNTNVISKTKDYVVVEARDSAIIWSKRHINLPWIRLKLPWVTPRDIIDINFALDHEFDFIAASFVRNKQWIDEIRELFSKRNDKHIKLISKIENQEAIENIDDIIKYSDWIMVARWDLWVEIPIEKLSAYQIEIVKKSKNLGKFVIIATHLLETMIDNPFPTRAESSDIFNSVLLKPDCLMLSWETAIWKFPIKAVKIMVKISEEAENYLSDTHEDYSNEWLCERDIEKKILIKNWIFTWEELNASALLILTKTWLLARLASAFRPNIKVFAITNFEASVRTINSLYNVSPIYLENWNSLNYIETMDLAINYLLKNNFITKDCKIIAINDLQKDWKEIPVIELITVKEFL